MQPDPVAEAIRALTALARHTRLRGGVEEPVDFADYAAHILTTVAANQGGVEELLAGRPGSWEADLVRQLINGTAPGDELHQYGTETAGGPEGTDPEWPARASGPEWSELLNQDRVQAANLREDRSIIPTAPGVYVWIDPEGHPVYAGRALTGRGLRERLSRHLATDLDLSHSTFRSWAAVQALGVTREHTRARPTLMTVDEIDVVNQWVGSCAVGWLTFDAADDAKQFEESLLGAWKPPLNAA